jgi:hypothetical protein
MPTNPRIAKGFRAKWLPRLAVGGVIRYAYRTMKHWTGRLVLGLAFVVLVLACRPGGVSVSELKSTFKTAEPALRMEADKAVAALKAGKSEEALTILRKLAGRAKLSADQQLAIKNTIAQVEKRLAAPPPNRPTTGR